jgi:hypothetical protein
MLWTDKENSVNDTTPMPSTSSSATASVITSSGGLRRRALRSGSGGSTGSFGDAEEEERMHRSRRKRSRTTDLGDASSTASNSFSSSRSSSRSGTPTPDLQEEGYRRDRRRSSSITTLIHALGVEVGESGAFGDGRVDSPRFASSSSSSSARRRRKSSSFGGLRSTSYSQGSDFPGSGDIFDNEALGRALCQKIVGRMKHHGIRLLALDWDLTVLDCHTRNNWYGPATELARHIRPLFKHLMNQALAADMSVAIVTFSEQARLVRDAVAHAIPAADGEPGGGGSRIIVRGCDQSWDSSEIFDRYFDRDLVCDEEPGSNAFGKLPHLASAMCEVERREGGLAIDHDEVLLVDDDRQNCMIAGAQKLKTIVFHAQDVNRAFGEMGEMFSRSSRGGGPEDFDSPAPKSISGLRMPSAGKWTSGSGMAAAGEPAGEAGGSGREYRRK